MSTVPAPDFMKDPVSVFYYIRSDDTSLYWRNSVGDYVIESRSTGRCELIYKDSDGETVSTFGGKDFDSTIDKLSYIKRQMKRDMNGF